MSFQKFFIQTHRFSRCTLTDVQWTPLVHCYLVKRRWFVAFRWHNKLRFMGNKFYHHTVLPKYANHLMVLPLAYEVIMGYKQNCQFSERRKVTSCFKKSALEINNCHQSLSVYDFKLVQLSVGKWFSCPGYLVWRSCVQLPRSPKGFPEASPLMVYAFTGLGVFRTVSSHRGTCHQPPQGKKKK